MPTTLPEIILPVADPQPSSRRNGKIARLPRATRNMINKMLDDGLPYHVILDEIGEAGEAINTQNLTNWKQGGYQDWLKQQDLIKRTLAQTEFAIDLLRETGDVDLALVMRTCKLVALNCSMPWLTTATKPSKNSSWKSHRAT